VELLVVIGVIAVLISLLIPVAMRARRSGETVRCLANQRALVQACLFYSHDYRGVLPYTGFSHQLGISNWCYFDDPNIPHFKGLATEVKTGLIWKYINNLDVYRCPSDKGPWVSGTVNNLTSYNLNGAVSGFGNNGGTYSGLNIDQLKAKAVMFFEVPMSGNGNGSGDATNYPGEGIAARHKHGTTVSHIDGSAEVWSSDEYLAKCSVGPSDLWCDPTAKDGGLGKYLSFAKKSSITSITIQE
jgi:type II secretory pathway pseudopilin PulG